MNIKRREFLKKCAGLAAAAAMPGRVVKASSPNEIPKHRLGRTGWNCTILGYGAMQCSDPAVIRHGIDLGINYIDTADCYMGGRNEKIVGEAIKGLRDKLFIATKVHISSERRMRSSVERSLKSLGIDRIDLMQLHGVSARRHVENQDTREIMNKMREEGLFRFAGVTTHTGQKTVVDTVVEDGFYDCILVAVNYRSGRALLESIEAASAAGVGIIAMKTQNGGYTNNPFPGLNGHQASLRHIIELPGINTAVPGMLSKRMVEENVAAAKTPASLADLLLLESMKVNLEGRACSFCSDCVDQCRYSQGAVDVARIRMYAEGYRDLRLAREQAQLAYATIDQCSSCEDCTVICSQGIDIKASAKVAAEVLAS